MEKKYNLGKYGIVETNDTMGSLMAGCFRKNTAYDFSGEDKNDVEKKLLTSINKERNLLLIEANNLKELALRIKENGLEATSRYYQRNSSKKT
ncbi:MAG: hypothetical protein KJ566_03120 [Nanoarchaeota archaeon]|nr:hypothetical protein [Nanoarchaeota archaeon]